MAIQTHSWSGWVRNALELAARVERSAANGPLTRLRVLLRSNDASYGRAAGSNPCSSGVMSAICSDEIGVGRLLGLYGVFGTLSMLHFWPIFFMTLQYSRSLTFSSSGFSVFINAPCFIALGDSMTRRCGNAVSMIQPFEESTTS